MTWYICEANTRKNKLRKDLYCFQGNAVSLRKAQGFRDGMVSYFSEPKTKLNNALEPQRLVNTQGNSIRMWPSQISFRLLIGFMWPPVLLGKMADPTRDWPRLARSVQKSPVEARVRGGLLQRWEAERIAVHARDLLKEVAVIFITPTIVWPQVRSREGTQLHPSTES